MYHLCGPAEPLILAVYIICFCIFLPLIYNPQQSLNWLSVNILLVCLHNLITVHFTVNAYSSIISMSLKLNYSSFSWVNIESITKTTRFETLLKFSKMTNAHLMSYDIQASESEQKLQLMDICKFNDNGVTRVLHIRYLRLER